MPLHKKIGLQDRKSGAIGVWVYKALGMISFVIRDSKE